MSETPIQVGQKWVSRDKRDDGMEAEIIACDPSVNEPGNNGFVTIKRFRKSQVRVSTLRSRYRLATQDGPR